MSAAVQWRRTAWLVVLLLCVGVAGFGREIVLLGTTDVHGRIDTPTGGFAKLAVLIEAQRAAAKNGSLLLDCGDAMQGTFGAYWTRGGLIARALTDLRYDVFVPGNHDFEFGGEALKARLTELRSGGVAVLAANVVRGEPGAADLIAPYRVFRFPGGIRIGVIGLAENMTPYRNCDAGGFSFTEEKTALRRAVGELKKQNVSAIVLARHNGLYARGGSLAELLKVAPEVDAVLGGHSHQLDAGTRVGNALYVQAGRHGEALAVLTLEFDDGDGRLKQVRGRLRIVDPDSAADARLLTAWRPMLNEIEQAGAFRFSVPRTCSAPEQLAMSAMLRSSGADVAVYWGTRDGATLPETVDRSAMYRFFPFANRVCRVELEREELRRFLTEQCALEGQNKYQRFFVSGLVLKRERNGALHSVVLSQERYSVAIPDYVLAGSGRPNAISAAWKHDGAERGRPTLMEAVEAFLTPIPAARD